MKLLLSIMILLMLSTVQAKTWTLLDDFEDANVNTSIWNGSCTTGQTDYVESGGILKTNFTGTSDRQNCILKAEGFADKKEYKFECRQGASAVDYPAIGLGKGTRSDTDDAHHPAMQYGWLIRLAHPADLKIYRDDTTAIRANSVSGDASNYQNYTMIINATGFYVLYNDNETPIVNATLTTYAFNDSLVPYIAGSMSEAADGNIECKNIWYINANTRPVATVSILNKPLSVSDDLNATISFSDSNNDNWTANNTRWYNGTMWLSQYNNLTRLSSTNTSAGETWTFSAQVYDGTDWSTWTNDSVSVGDSTAPVINELTVSSNSVTTSNSVTFSANVTDAGSTITSTACQFTLRKSNYNGGNGVGNPYNETTNSKSGDVVSFQLGMSAIGIGTLEWQSAYCEDNSNNVVSNYSVSINITITSPPTPTVSGGGGGGGTSPECFIDEDCFKLGKDFYCVASKCIKLDREDIAYTNLLARNLPEDVISQLLKTGQGKCNFDGICQIAEGENRFNCGSSTWDISNRKVIVEGDCSGLELNFDSDFITTVGIFMVILIGILFLANKKRR